LGGIDLEECNALNLLQLKGEVVAKRAAAAVGADSSRSGAPRQLCTTGNRYNPAQLMVYECDSDIMSEGTEFCVNGETFTVGSSWDSVGGATVNLAAGESFGRGLFKKGDELTVGACAGSGSRQRKGPHCTTGSRYNPAQLMVYSCDSDVMSEGTKFCVSGETFTVGSSWNSAGGATVNLAAGESFARGLFEKGDELTVGACGSGPRQQQ
jgi:hypothetical protein